MVRGGYRATEVGVLPEDWELIDFEDCFELLPNNTLSRAELNYDSGEIKNIHYGDILMSLPSILDCSVVELPFINAGHTIKNNRSFLKDGDVIIADTAEDESVGKATEVFGVETEKVVSGLHTIPCRPKVMFEPKWLGYFINHDVYHDQLLPYITGTKVSAISKSSIKETIIVKPASEEQTAIVTALSDIDELIISFEKLIEKKRAIKKGAMQELLTGKKRLSGFAGEWNEYKVSNIGGFYSGLSGKKAGDFGVGNSKYITFLNVLSNYWIDISILGSVNVSDNEKQNAVQYGDLFFNTSSETPEEVGMCSALLCNLNNTYLNSFCFGFRLNSTKIDPLFLSYYFNSEIGRKIMSVLAQGATRYNLSKSAFANTIITIPSFEEQKEISKVLYEIDIDVEQLKKKLNKYQKIRTGMMNELLTGKIRLI